VPVSEVPVSEVPAVSTASTPSESSDLPRPSNLGIWSFVLAILGLGLLPIVGSVVGFILGRVAIRQADTRRLRGGRGLAIAAVTISVITLVVIALSIAAYALVVAYLEI
jgi:putative exporter of polyketide antibiotics